MQRNGIDDVGRQKDKVKIETKLPRGAKPKIEKIDLHQVEKFGEYGFTDVEIADLLGIAKSTLNNYKKKYPEFFESLKRGKEVADEKVVRALFNRATGYSHPDVHVSNYQGVVTVTKIIKHYPPDTGAAIFWLYNRQRDRWTNRPKPEPEEGEANNELKFEGWD